MRQALQQAEEAARSGEVPVGAVLVDAFGKALARDRNRVEQLKDVTAHAEALACTAAAYALGGKYLKDCTLYVTLEPCPMCAGALRWFQIGRVVYGAADPKGGYLKYAPDVLHPKTRIEGGLLADESAALLKVFFRRKRK